MILRESSKTLICGGAIIGDQFVLSSASCVNGYVKTFYMSMFPQTHYN